MSNTFCQIFSCHLATLAAVLIAHLCLSCHTCCGHHDSTAAAWRDRNGFQDKLVLYAPRAGWFSASFIFSERHQLMLPACGHFPRAWLPALKAAVPHNGLSHPEATSPQIGCDRQHWKALQRAEHSQITSMTISLAWMATPSCVVLTKHEMLSMTAACMTGVDRG